MARTPSTQRSSLHAQRPVQGHDGGFVLFAAHDKLDVHFAQRKAGAANVDAGLGQGAGGAGQQAGLVDVGADEADQGGVFDGYLFVLGVQGGEQLRAAGLFPR